MKDENGNREGFHVTKGFYSIIKPIIQTIEEHNISRKKDIDENYAYMYGRMTMLQRIYNVIDQSEEQIDKDLVDALVNEMKRAVNKASA